MIDRRHIGYTTTPSAVRVDAWRVKLFCRATGETDPVYWDEAAARAAGHPACPVPPTFLKALEAEHIDSAALLKQLGVPQLGVLNAEQSFEIVAPIHVGDLVEVSRSVTDAYDKKGGALTFIVIDSAFRVAARRVAGFRQVIVVRNAVQAQ